MSEYTIVFLGRADCILGRQIVFWGGRDAYGTIKFSFCGTGFPASS
ncbi:hypothetical protein [Microcoleus sp. AR_TQ3_B6]